ncbi:hypothetical protein [Pontibacter actiniarum]|uniref:Uncharacterized protein n=1 Tax=Pontibacter actiniarum TaxID=323450 RepID=A0A1X9YNX3_9BACT|nr:hypothetical protein [Pontibacter actiniarum]ARS34562.1 hypothetical protein CA264_03385 [Pontibacter actiniarum]
MADKKDKSNELKNKADTDGIVNAGRQRAGQTGPIAGGADNTRGENKPSREGTSGGAKKGKESASPDTPKGKRP